MDTQKIHTTVNLSSKNAVSLEDAARQLHLKRSKLVAMLLRKMLKKAKSLQRYFTPVHYQKNIDGDEWKVVHIFIDDRDYEVFIDMRNFFKWSVSALLAMAINKYLDELLNADSKVLKDQYDNYKIIDYHCDAKLNKNMICWHIKWELSEKLAQKISL